MRVLDLFCGVGGAALGYARAGFEVVGIDLNPQPHYPFHFVQADALKPPVRLEDFDVIHASPPCQVFTRAKHLRKAQGGKTKKVDLVAPTREMLIASGVPYIIENVPDAPLIDPVRVCGSSFGLRVRRHRMFESSLPLIGTNCDHKRQGRPIGVYHVMGDEIPKGGATAKTLDEGQWAMGLTGIPWESLKEAVPPAYTLYLGVQLLYALGRASA